MLDSPLDDLFPDPDLGYEQLSDQELIDLLRVDPGETQDDPSAALNIYLYTGITMELASRGSKAREMLRQELDQAHPDAMRAILMALAVESRDKTRIRRTLFKYLEGDDPSRSAIAIEGFSFLQDRKARARVLALRGHASADVRIAILAYVAEVLPEEALSALIEALDDQDPQVRLTALFYLIRVSVLDGLPDVRQMVTQLRKDRDWEVRRLAGDVLEHRFVPPDYGTDLLEDGLYRLQTQPANAKTLWREIERARNDDLAYEIPLLLAALAIRSPDDERLRDFTRELVIDPGTGQATRLDDIFVAASAITLLHVIGDWDVQDAILALREHDSPEIAEEAYCYLRYLDPAAAFAERLKLLSSPDPWLRRCSVEALALLPVYEVDDDTRATVSRYLNDSDERIHAFVEQALKPAWQRRIAPYRIAGQL